MPKRSYDRLTVEKFGHQLIVSGDLDPVYIALHRCAFTFDVLSKWLIGYWCLYHCGAASFLAEQSDADFWDTLMLAARNEAPAPTGGRWPRASERRHWRGQQAMRSVEDLSFYRGTPAELVESLWDGDMDFASVSKRVQAWRGFGPWIAFKVADMLDRVMGRPVDFDEAAVFMFKDPRKAALMQWRVYHPEQADIGPPEEAIRHVVNRLIGTFSNLKAPPDYRRPIGLQEVETVLCKWKSHMNGHYPLFNDTDEINEGMVNWLPHSDVAKAFAKNMVQRDPRR